MLAKTDQREIREADILCFMEEKYLANVLQSFEEAAERKSISKTSLENWTVNVYKERKILAHFLNDNKTATKELNNIFSGIILVLITIVWLILMGFTTTKVLVYISSHILVAVFTFGNTLKTVFEGIIFVYVEHRFDIGDRCVIDNEQMVVEDIGIRTTTFLKDNNDKSYYPNSILATKHITNYKRSPEMSEFVELVINVSTSNESIVALKLQIDEFLESKPENWRPGHSLELKEIDDERLKFDLQVSHTMNFQNYREKNKRRSELVFELKKAFEELGIKYLSVHSLRDLWSSNQLLTTAANVY